MFQKTLFPKRFFLLDFKKAELVIKRKQHDEDKEIVLFGNIIRCQNMEEDLWGPDDNKFCFKVLTNKRDYLLYASTENEKNLWIAGFNYLIFCSKIIQDLMKDN